MYFVGDSFRASWGTAEDSQKKRWRTFWRIL